MLRRSLLPLASLALCITPSLGGAQSDSVRIVSGESGLVNLNSRVDVNYATRVTDPASGRRAWLQLAILWRGQPAWRAVAYDDSIATRSAEREYQRRGLDAIAVGGQWAGTQVGRVVFGAIYDPGGRWVQILGKRWTLPPGDSALVVLVDRIDSVGGPPMIVEGLFIESSLPANLFWYNTELRDTSLSLRRSGSVRDALRELLSRTATIREFWK